MMTVNLKQRTLETYTIRDFLLELGNSDLKSMPASIRKRDHSLVFESDMAFYMVRPDELIFKSKKRKDREWFGYLGINSGMFRLVRLALSDRLEIPKAEIKEKEIVFTFSDGSQSRLEVIGAGIIQVSLIDGRVLMLKYDPAIDRLVSVNFVVQPVKIMQEVG